MWAGLLASASQDPDVVTPPFVETLKQLTPDEARYLQRLHDGALEQKRQRHRAGRIDRLFLLWEEAGVLFEQRV